MKQNTVIVAIGDSGKRIVSGIEYEQQKIILHLEPEIEQDSMKIEVLDKNNNVDVEKSFKIHPKYNIHKNNDGTKLKLDLSNPYFFGDKDEEIFGLVKDFDVILLIVPLGSRSGRQLSAAFVNLCLEYEKQVVALVNMPLELEGIKLNDKASQALKYLEQRIPVTTIKYDYTNADENCRIYQLFEYAEEKTCNALKEILRDKYKV